MNIEGSKLMNACLGVLTRLICLHFERRLQDFRETQIPFHRNEVHAVENDIEQQMEGRDPNHMCWGLVI